MSKHRPDGEQSPARGKSLPQIGVAGAGERSAAGALPPVAAVVEAVVLLVPVILLEWLVPSFPDLTLWQPHPYWFAVLLLSLQYGVPSGLMAAAIAIVGQVLIGLPEPDIGENHFYYLVRVWTTPVLWLVAAILLGSFRTEQLRRNAELVERVDVLGAQRQSLFEQATSLRQRCDRLERRIVSRSTSEGEQLLDAFARLERARSDQISSAFAAAAGAAFPTGALSLLAATGAGLEVVATANWPQSAQWSRRIMRDAAIWRAVVGEARSLSMLKTGDALAIGRDAMFVVPVFAPRTGDVIGAVRIDMLPPGLVHAGTGGRLAVLARHAAAALAAPASDDTATFAAPTRRQNVRSLTSAFTRERQDVATQDELAPTDAQATGTDPLQSSR